MSDKKTKKFINGLISIDIQPGLVLRAVLFALVLPGTLNAAFGIDRQVFLETMALLSTIFDSYAQSIFAVFEVVWVKFSFLENFIAQFYLFVVYPALVTVVFEAGNAERASKSKILEFLFVALTGVISTLFLILFIRFLLSFLNLAALLVAWISTNTPLLYFGFFSLLVFLVANSVVYMLKYSGLSIVLFFSHFFRSRAYQDYVIVVLATFAFFFTIEAMRLGTGFNRLLCGLVLELSPQRETIVSACSGYV